MDNTGAGAAFPLAPAGEVPRCGSVRLLGHGFVPAYFDEAPTAIWLRCFRCPDCRAVIRLRPRGYWGRFKALVETIRPSLFNKPARGRWDPWLSGRAWPRPAGRRKGRALSLPEPPNPRVPLS
ncbi:hypothetical protein DFAR_870002 [Desulfarculales bacterium]